MSDPVNFSDPPTGLPPQPQSNNELTAAQSKLRKYAEAGKALQLKVEQLEKDLAIAKSQHIWKEECLSKGVNPQAIDDLLKLSGWQPTSGADESVLKKEIARTVSDLKAAKPWLFVEKAGPATEPPSPAQLPTQAPPPGWQPGPVYPTAYPVPPTGKGGQPPAPTTGLTREQLRDPKFMASLPPATLQQMIGAS